MYNILQLHSVAITLYQTGSTQGYEIYGEIEANDMDGCIQIYNESKESCKPLLENGTLYLTGPSRSIWAPNYSLGVYLKDKYTGLEVANGFYGVSYPYPIPSASLFNRPITITINGEHGFATLYTTMYTSAVEVTVEVKLVIDSKGPQRKIRKVSGIGDNSKSLHTIHGTLSALCSDYDRENNRENYRIMLFSRSSGDPQDVQDVIPLSRCEVAVPMSSALTIEADLWDGTRTQVAKDMATFDFPYRSEYGSFVIEKTANIEGAEGCIEVKVTWRGEW